MRSDIKPRIYDLNGQTVFPQDFTVKANATIFVEITVQGSRLYKAVEFPMSMTIADCIKCGWNFGRTEP